MQSITRGVGMGSRVLLFFALLPMSLRTFSSVRELNLLNEEGGTVYKERLRLYKRWPCSSVQFLRPALV